MILALVEAGRSSRSVIWGKEYSKGRIRVCFSNFLYPLGRYPIPKKGKCLILGTYAVSYQLRRQVHLVGRDRPKLIFFQDFFTQGLPRRLKRCFFIGAFSGSGIDMVHD